MNSIEDRNLVERRDVLDKLVGTLPSVESDKLMEVYLSLINSRDPDTRAVLIPVKQFCEKLGWKSVPGTAILKEYVDCFTDIKIKGEDPEKGIEYESINMFEVARLRWFNGIRCFEIKPTASAQPLLFNYKNHYVSYMVGNVYLFSSQVMIRLHRLLQREAYRKSPYEISLEELKIYLHVEDKYLGEHGWNEFMRNVLEVGKAEINLLTDLNITYGKGKLGAHGKVESVVFHIQKDEEKAKKIAGESVISTSDITDTPLEKENATIEFKKRSDFSSSQEYIDYVESLPIDVQQKLIEEELRMCELSSLKEIVCFTFSDNEIQVIYDVLCDIVSDDEEDAWEIRYDILKGSYLKLRAYEAKSKDSQKPIKNRLSYLLTILQS